MSKIKVGLPRAFQFHSYGLLWYTWLRELGVEIVLSGTTTQGTLDVGGRCMVDGACLPLKILSGHVEELSKAGVDYLFLPRVVKPGAHTYTCPKAGGLPELVLSTARTKLPPLLSPTIEGSVSDPKPYYRIGRRLGAGKRAVQTAFQKAYAAWQKQQERIRMGVKGDQPTIGLLGHSYITEDRWIGHNVKKELNAHGYQVVRPANSVKNPGQTVYPRFMFWQSGQDSAGLLQSTNHADGYIFLSAFGCGPDSYVETYCRKACERVGVPYMALTVDEQTGQAGMVTRLEAFMDVVERQGRQRA